MYLRDPFCSKTTSQITSLGRDDNGQWLVLADNIFHPQGGGQPADRGTVEGIAAVPFRLPDDRSVVAVRLDESGNVFSLSQRVEAMIDLELRRIHSALHTAGHVVQAIAELRGWRVVANNHFPGQARVEFIAPAHETSALADDACRNEMIDAFQSATDGVVLQRLAVTASEDESGLRNVRIGEWHTTPCGGTHVRDLGDLEDMRVTSIKLKKGIVRVAYDTSHSPETK